jgi:murein DD-endopeptidase MepM/ murein hydrolase activator NlpD
MAATGLLLLSACDNGFNLTQIGRAVDPVPVYKPVQERQQPDARGVITYPTYQVIVAGDNDSLPAMASRVGISAADLADYNGLPVDHRVTKGQVLALPNTVARPDGSASTGRSIEEIASSAIDRAPGTAPAEAGNDPAEPIRHIVEPGETAYSIARLYDVSVTSLASWNGLDRDLTVRVGQQLLIPVSNAGTRTAAAPVAAPGRGSATPTPPSASKPLPEPVKVAKIPDSPNLTADRTPAGASGKLLTPVDGKILRGYSKGSKGNEGIDIAASAGTAVKAADTGEVALISKSVGDTTILLIRHPDNLYTVYSNITGVSLTKGQKVSRGQTIGKVAKGNPSFLHFEIRRGTESIDPAPYL